MVEGEEMNCGEGNLDIYIGLLHDFIVNMKFSQKKFRNLLKLGRLYHLFI